MSNISSSEEDNYTDLIIDGSVPCFIVLEEPNWTGVAVSYVVVFFLSLLGNSVVIYVVCQMKGRRTSTDMYLMNLALADLLFSLTLPFWAAYTHLNHWVFGNFLCKLLSGIQEVTFYSCVFLLACISIDRYMAIVKATQFISKQRHLVQVICGLVWMGAFLLAMPVIVLRESLENGDTLICYENTTADQVDEWRVGLRILRHTVGFFLPLAVMLFCYGWTMCTLFHSRNNQKQKAMRVILCVVLAFVVCWLPHNITEFIDTLVRGQLMTDTCDRKQAVDMALRVTEVIAYMHCAINPLLYAFIGKKFRNHLMVSLVKKGVVQRDVVTKFRLGSIYSSGGSSRHTSVTL